jgi:hypothetical protein
VKQFVQRNLGAGRGKDFFDLSLAPESVQMKNWLAWAIKAAREDQQKQKEFVKTLEDTVEEYKEVVENHFAKQQGQKEQPKLDLGVQETQDLIFKFVKLAVFVSMKKQPTNESISTITSQLDNINDDQFVEVIEKAKSEGKLTVDDITNFKHLMRDLSTDQSLQDQFRKIVNEQIPKAKQEISQAQAEQPKPEAEPETPGEPNQNQDPEEFDVDPKAFEALKKSAEAFVNTFYQQKYLVKQGELIKNVLSALQKIKSQEELEAAAQQVQEAQVRAAKTDLRNLQVSMRTFLQMVKKSKTLLKNFTDKAEKGSVMSGSAKQKFMKFIKEIQDAVFDVVVALRAIQKQTLTEQTKTEDKWKEIGDGFKLAAEPLKNIMTADKPEQIQNLEKNINDAIEALGSITHHFPSVNPFKSKDIDFASIMTNFEAAIDGVKPALQNVLELARDGEGSNTVLKRAEKDLREFSGTVASIFGKGAESAFPEQKQDVRAEPAQPTAGDEAEPKKIEATKEVALNRFKQLSTARRTKQQFARIIGQEADNEKINEFYAGMVLLMMMYYNDATLNEAVTSSKIPKDLDYKKVQKALIRIKKLNEQLYNSILALHDDDIVSQSERVKIYGLFTFIEKIGGDFKFDKTFVDTLAIRLDVKTPTEEPEEDESSLQMQVQNLSAEQNAQAKQSIEGGEDPTQVMKKMGVDTGDATPDEIEAALLGASQKDVSKELPKIKNEIGLLPSEDRTPIGYFESKFGEMKYLEASKESEPIDMEPILSRFFSLYQQEFSKLEENLGAIKRNLPTNQAKAFDQALDAMESSEMKTLMGFLGQVDSGSMKRAATQSKEYQRLQTKSPVKAFVSTLLAISSGLLKAPESKVSTPSEKTKTTSKEVSKLAQKLAQLDPNSVNDLIDDLDPDMSDNDATDILQNTLPDTTSTFRASEIQAAAEMAQQDTQAQTQEPPEEPADEPEPDPDILQDVDIDILKDALMELVGDMDDYRNKARKPFKDEIGKIKDDSLTKDLFSSVIEKMKKSMEGFAEVQKKGDTSGKSTQEFITQRSKTYKRRLDRIKKLGNDYINGEIEKLEKDFFKVSKEKAEEPKEKEDQRSKMQKIIDAADVQDVTKEERTAVMHFSQFLDQRANLQEKYLKNYIGKLSMDFLKWYKESRKKDERTYQLTSKEVLKNLKSFFKKAQDKGTLKSIKQLFTPSETKSDTHKDTDTKQESIEKLIKPLVREMLRKK